MKNLTKISLHLIILLLAVSVADVAAQTKKPKRPKKTKNKVTQINKGQTANVEEKAVKYTADAETFKELENAVSVVESKKDWARFDRQAPRVSPNGTRSAYIAGFAIDGDAENLRDVIVVDDATTGKMYEIRGLTFPRPLENIKWQTDDVIVFDQWMNPNFGGRYAVDFKAGKLVAYGTIE